MKDREKYREKNSGKDRRKETIAITVLRALLTAVTAAYLCWIFSNSVKTAPESSAASEKVLAAVQSVADKVLGEGKLNVSMYFIRKAAHFSEFALFAFLAFFTCYSYVFKKPHAAAVSMASAAALALICGGADEIIQIFSEGRGPAVFDAMIDFSGGVAGAFCALLILLIAKSIAKKRRKKRDRRNIPGENTSAPQNEEERQQS